PICYEEVPDPVIGDSDVLVRVQAISLEGGDLLNRRTGRPASTPHVVGYPAAGVVAGGGSKVERVVPGDRVAAFNWFGSHAELFAVPEAHAWRLPEGLDIGIASTVPVTFGTAGDALFEYGRLQ